MDETVKDRDYAKFKKWIEENAPDAVQKAYWIMVKAETERDAMKESLAAANARADAAEADAKHARGVLATCAREEKAHRDALAAARRECDRYRKLCAEARQWIEVGIPRSAARNEFLTALAAPAAGEEGKHGG